MPDIQTPDPRTVDVHIPATLADRLGGPGPALDRRALEALAVAAYQTGRLTDHELRQLLGIETHQDLADFLKARGISLDPDKADSAREQQSLPGQGQDEREAAADLVARFKAFRAGKTLGGLSIKELIAEGRR